MTPLWLDRPRKGFDDPMPDDGGFDDVVVGAGLTGLVTALLLARAGRRVGVLEARHVGAVATGRTTAKASVLQATKLSQLLQQHSTHRVRAYVEANREGLAWLRRFCADHGVPVESRDAVTFAATAEERRTVRQEYDAARSLGVDVTWADSLDVPFPVHGAVLLRDQMQFDPVEVLYALADQVRAHGGTVHEGQRVLSASWTGQSTLRLEGGQTVRADNVVLATGVPILDRAVTFAKVEPKRSYLLAYSGAGAPEGMYISAGSDTRSLRDISAGRGAPGFLVGGSGHTVGRTRSESEHLDELRRWASVYLPDAEETHAWSAQDYTSYDGLPLFGKLPLGLSRFYYATGFDKWGMTNGVAASLYLAARILGDHPQAWGRDIAGRRPTPRTAVHVSGINAKVGAAMGAGLAEAELRSLPETVAEGEGVVGRDKLVPTGLCKVGGVTERVTAVCTHLGGTVRWNDAEKTWDCPLHGSRFSPDGSLLEGPATRPLHRRDGQDQ